MNTPLSLPEPQRIELERAYRTPIRAYHDYGHVQAVLQHYREVAEGPGWRSPVEVWLAVLYHDAIYEVGRSDNETRSAAYAAESIAIWPPSGDVDTDRVIELIELTARHGQFSPTDFTGESADDTRHFLDCDMAILGAEPAVFDAYDRAIAAEYRGHVPGWLYRINRKRFLKALLSRERIFLSDFFHDRFDQQARRNLRRAITHKQ